MMKCSKITLRNRNELRNPQKSQSSRQDRNAMWFTNGYHGYSYKLFARTKGSVSFREPNIEPQLTITTLLFPDDTSFNTGSSLERWSKKTPRLISAKSKNNTPRKNMIDDEYDFSYAIEDILKAKNPEEPCLHEPDNDLAIKFEEYYVPSDIEELMLKSQRSPDLISVKKKHKSRKKTNEDTSANNKRNKYKKNIKFSFSKPPSPETEQVIRVDVTSNVSFEEISMLEIAKASQDCTKGHRKINEKLNNFSFTKFDDNNNKHLNAEGVEEDDFIVKCRQLALTQKKLQ